MEIRKLKADEIPPMDLLVLADPSKQKIGAYLAKGECFVAEIDHRIVGVYVLLQTTPGNVEIMNVAVAEDLQGRGIGKELVLDAVQLAKNQGFATIHVTTGNSSIGQLALYQKCGFRMVGIDTDHFIIHYPEEIFENGIQCRDRVRFTLKLKPM
ncbi:GNAT family N-acetyltransferase [Sporosarcina gallistercoris]|uniref:GNAT family N-acetyltransferase n=1 Tax=Sporosarcina gallistercoris TaxID=2762245 RepID=A0ABR8PMX2_9BACL|nr:GNAT family N-acetyltransferase [Sporosarcina gallistercoris]MBD7909494.1 GNAT family N-acetyltransferase [Sporosarcina gallistercoris]